MKDKTGLKFGKLKVLRFIGKVIKNNKLRYMYECKCDCGNIVIRESNTLREDHICSCGCYKGGVQNKKHGLWSYDNKLYAVWQTMKARCYRQNKTKFYAYGGRGIKICNEWKNDFENFYNWAINNGYKEGLSIDRIDVNGNYEPSNCQWVTNKKQARNKRNNVFIEFNNEKHCLSEWAEILNINYKVLHNRLYKGWSIEKAFNTPLRSKKRNKNEA